MSRRLILPTHLGSSAITLCVAHNYKTYKILEDQDHTISLFETFVFAFTHFMEAADMLQSSNDLHPFSKRTFRVDHNVFVAPIESEVEDMKVFLMRLSQAAARLPRDPAIARVVQTVANNDNYDEPLEDFLIINKLHFKYENLYDLLKSAAYALHRMMN
jgi:hypothetical protein